MPAGRRPADIWAPKRSNGGGSLDASDVRQLADFLSDVVLPRLRPGERMFPTGEITAEPDDGTFYREESELWRNYSLHREVLEAIIAFVRGAGGEWSFSELQSESGRMAALRIFVPD